MVLARCFQEPGNISIRAQDRKHAQCISTCSLVTAASRREADREAALEKQRREEEARREAAAEAARRAAALEARRKAQAACIAVRHSQCCRDVCWSNHKDRQHML